jgi:TonB-dependent SusC/RagA subfamily outer membrane receptor
MFMQKFFLLLINSLIVLCSAAQHKTTDEPIRVRSLSISIQANPFSAKTVMDIELFNPNMKVLDGEFNFSLHESQVVTGFALDINGKMREGVVVEKQKARVAYENTIRRRVDPGLLEITAGNNYRVRVYPMPANGRRKINITIQQNLVPVEGRMNYFLPLTISGTVDHFTTKIDVRNSILSPFTGQGLLSQMKFDAGINNYVLALEKKSFIADKAVSFSIPFESTGKAICLDSNGYFVARWELPPIEEKHVIHSATVFWDVSSSADKRDVAKELFFLENYLKQFDPDDLQIVCFSNAVYDVRSFTNPSHKIAAIKSFLSNQVNDGGTQLGVLDCYKYGADEYLLFSDGVSNFGEESPKLSDKPVYCITSATVNNSLLLKSIASKSGGKHINMQNITADEALNSFKQGEWSFIKEMHSTGVADPVLRIANGYLVVTGKAENKQGTVSLTLQSGLTRKEEELVIESSQKCDSIDLSGSYIVEGLLKLTEENSEQKTTGYAKKNTIVTANTSLIVLDNLDDYFQYDIVPPKDLLDEYYRRIYVKKQRDDQKKMDELAEKTLLLQNAASVYNNRIRWWDKKVPLIDISKVDNKKGNAVSYNRNVNQQQTNTDSQPPVDANSFNFNKSNALNEVVVIGYGTQRRSSVTGSVTTMSSREISSLPNIATALEGKVAGVQVTNNNGVPGNVANIRIRGISGLDTNAEPLYVLDGVPVTANDASFINTNDIETITVLKDASATAIYGSRGSNGVIVMTSKRGRPGQALPKGIVKYKNLEDVDYVEELKDYDKTQKYVKYLEMKKTELGQNASFYFDVAEHLFNEGLKIEAQRVLSNLAELNAENHQVLRAMGYMFETWGDYENAIMIYKKVLSIKEEEPQCYRDLALAYEKNGNHQEAVDLLYTILTKNWAQYEGRYNGLRGIMLNELNAIIDQNRAAIDIGKIDTAILTVLPVDLRIVIDWNKDETDIDLHVIEPGGEECYYSHRETKRGGRISEDFTQGYGPEEYEIKKAGNGTYHVQVKYYGDRYQKQQVPSFIKVTIYKNYGRKNQTMSVQNLIMDGQTGMIEIADVKF